jgi:hypothetical protein
MLLTIVSLSSLRGVSWWWDSVASLDCCNAHCTACPQPDFIRWCELQPVPQWDRGIFELEIDKILSTQCIICVYTKENYQKTSRNTSPEVARSLPKWCGLVNRCMPSRGAGFKPTVHFSPTVGWQDTVSEKCEVHFGTRASVSYYRLPPAHHFGRLSAGFGGISAAPTRFSPMKTQILDF